MLLDNEANSLRLIFKAVTSDNLPTVLTVLQERFTYSDAIFRILETAINDINNLGN